MSTVLHHRTCPLCEATCGLEIELEGREVKQGPRRRGRRLQRRLHLPEGRQPRRAAQRPRPARATPACAATASSSRRAGRRPSRRSRQGSHRSSPTATATRSAPTSATRTRTPSTARCTCGRCSRASARATSSAPPRSIRCRSRSPCAYMFGAGLTVPIPDLDRTDLPADPRRQPARLQRLADDRPRRARAPARDPRARRQASSSSTRGARGPRRSPTSITSSVPGMTPTCSPAIAHTILEEELADPGEP